MSREDRRQKRIDEDNKPDVDDDGLAPDVAGGPEDYGVVSEQLDALEDGLVAANNRVADALDRIADLLTKLVTEKSNEIPK